jgi:iron complex outermembrane receptor protein
VKSGIVTWTSTSLSNAGTLTPANLNPEKSFDLEFGFKSLLLDKKLLLNVNLYQTKVTYYQTQVNVVDDTDPTGNTFKNVWTNAPGVVSRGIELEAAYQYNKALQFTATGALNSATYDGQFLVAKPDVDGANYTGINKFSDLNGKQLSNAPDTTLNLGVNYQAPIGGYLGRITLSNAFRSGTYLASNQSENSWQGGYSILNLGLGLGSLNKKWELALNATNLLDQNYASSKGSYSATGASSLQIGAPRYIGVTLKSSL